MDRVEPSVGGAIEKQYFCSGAGAMTWFVIFGIFGYLGYLEWQQLPDPPQKAAIRFATATFVTFFLILGGLILWNALSPHTHIVKGIVSQVEEVLQNGRVARSLLGLILGAGAAFAIANAVAKKSPVQNDGGGKPAQELLSGSERERHLG